MHISRIALSTALVAPLVLNSVALYLDRWFLIADGTSLDQKGLRQICDRDQCEKVQYDSMTIVVGDCERKGSAIKARETAVYFLLMASTVLVGISIVCFFLSSFRKVPVAVFIIGIIAVVLSFVCQGITGSFFYYNVSEWMFCGKNYCEFIGSSNCDISISTSYALWGVALASMFPVCISSSVLYRLSAIRSLRLQDAAQRATQSGKRNAEKKYTTNTKSQVGEEGEPREPSPLPQAAVPDGYELDPDSGYYWSAETGWYWEAASGHYLNAETNEWYNPESGEWYICE